MDERISDTSVTGSHRVGSLDLLVRTIVNVASAVATLRHRADGRSTHVSTQPCALSLSSTKSIPVHVHVDCALYSRRVASRRAAASRGNAETPRRRKLS